MTNTSYLDPTTWRLVTPKGVRYKLLDRSGNYDFDQVTCTEKVLIEANKLQAFIREVFPLPTVLNGIPIWQASAMPGVFPILTKSISWQAHVDGLPIDPFSADPDAPEGTYHPIIQVDITYNDSATQPGSGGGGDVDENDPETFLEISCNAAGEFLRNPSLCARWYNDQSGVVRANTTSEYPASTLIAETEWTITWPMLNYEFYKTVMIPRLREIRGKVNSTPYELLYNAPSETLLCTGWDVSEEHQVLFTDETDPQYSHAPVRLAVKMLEKNGGLITSNPVNVESALDPNAPVTRDDRDVYVGHNHFWEPENGGWRRFWVNEDNDNVYGSYEFNNLFAIPTDDNVP